MEKAAGPTKPGNSWPTGKDPVIDSYVIVASQGLRLWSAECELIRYNGNLHLACSDETTFANLQRQPRVAFTMLGNNTTGDHGSGLARVVSGDKTGFRIEVEPYRVTSGETTYESRINGWVAVTDEITANPKGLKFWYGAFRLVTVSLSAIPVLLGGLSGFALGQFNIILLLLTVLGTIAAHAGANAAADFFDFKKGVDLTRALSSHPGALAREKVEPERILLAALACFVVTAISGLVLLILVGWPLLLFGLAGVLGAFFYTGRPFSYKYRAMGELMLGILMGPIIVMGAFYVQTQQWDWIVFLGSVGLGMLVSSASLVNNLRDIPDDQAAGIRTLPMGLGVWGTKILYYSLTVGPYLMIVAMVAIQPFFWPMLLVFGSVPRAITAISALWHTSDDIADIRQKSLKHPYPLNSIRVHFLFGSLAAAGVIITGIIRLF